VIDIEALCFSYGDGAFSLQLPDLALADGEIVAVVGPSGSGKTTLLNLICGISVAERGSVRIDGTDIGALSDRERRQFRLANIGLVFQNFELLDYLDVVDNILLPARIGKVISLDADLRSRATQLAQSMGIADKLSRSVASLSQGERQRVAVCRALLADPGLILADEPTGNLDVVTKEQVLQALIRAAREQRATLVMVTHDLSILGEFDRVVDFSKVNVVDGIPA
jgi:putative ABC transport system ATP-binding protein